MADRGREAGNIPPQHQKEQPGKEKEMTPRPAAVSDRKSCRRLEGRVALISGGDSGIGRAVAVAFAQEGADVSIVYLNEHEDANETRQMVEEAGTKCLLIPGDVGDENVCREAVNRTGRELGGLQVLVNNAALQFQQKSLEDISSEQWEETFRTNIFSMFYMTKAALPQMKEGASIINTTSVTAYAGNPQLLDYSSTKGAIVSFTRSLALSLADKRIRVNAVAPGPIWTPLIPSTFSEEHVEKFGKNTALGKAGQPEEVAPCYVFLASDDASYMTGQVLHPNGGRVING
jgi:NAD(P)-dependent dehydrogenase (short-subunit alcohol dehydrogenase family)